MIALGARWDAAKKIWYITDVVDLTQFMRWIPDLAAASERSGAAAKVPARQSPGVITKSSVAMSDCACKVPPWVDCEHSC